MRADAPEGVIIAQGARSTGAVLQLHGGKPALTVVTRGKVSRIQSTSPIIEALEHPSLHGSAPTPRGLLVNGQEVARGKLADTLATPNDAIQIGTDLGSKVDDTTAITPFRGLIERVRLFSAAP
ncbi:MAG: hypothetical protein U0794_11760 [Isosphaeraceae bacterium]